MESCIKSYEIFSENAEHITLKGMTEAGACIGFVSISLKFRGWVLGCCSYFSSQYGLKKVSSGGRGWRLCLIEEAKAGLQDALR